MNITIFLINIQNDCLLFIIGSYGFKFIFTHYELSEIEKIIETYKLSDIKLIFEKLNHFNSFTENLIDKYLTNQSSIEKPCV